MRERVNGSGMYHLALWKWGQGGDNCLLFQDQKTWSRERGGWGQWSSQIACWDGKSEEENIRSCIMVIRIVKRQKMVAIFVQGEIDNEKG